MSDKRMTVRIVQSKVFEISVPETPGGGYVWRLVENSFVRIVNEVFRSEGAGAGASGVRVFWLEPLVPTPFQLILELKRPWEPSAIERYVVDVTD